jgi:cell division protein FtsI/penicillin-binding protein 2
MRDLRINLIFFFIAIFSLAIIWRLVSLQILNKDFYKALSQGFHTSFEDNQTERGEIFFAGGEPLAITVEFPFVFASPLKIKNPEETAKILSQILTVEHNSTNTLQENYTVGSILEKLKKDSFYSPIKRKLSQKEVEELKKINLEGIYLSKEKIRYYPQETMASQIVGFVDADGRGQYGLEEFFNDILKSEEKRGSDLILTIDYNIQFKAEKLLEKAKNDLDIEGGQIIVIDPQTGKIIALAHFPNFNPNEYEKYAKEGGLEIFKNAVTQKLFEPGSSFKPITMAAALEEEKVTPQTTYQDPGEIKIDGYKIYNYEKRRYPGEITMTQVLEKSINTGAVFVQKKLGKDNFLKYIERFGFFQKTGIDLLEIYSENKEIKKMREINLATASFGQGIEITPIQLARAYCAIANGGKLVRPYLVEKIIKEGKVVKETQPEISLPIISPKTARELTTMLVSVVENGFAKRAKIPGYYIAGKTGTAQVPFSSLGIPKAGYSEKTIQTFVGYAPAFDPKFLILVKLDNPKSKTAEYSAVPIFHELAEYIIYLWQIPPDYEPNQKT